MILKWAEYKIENFLFKNQSLLQPFYRSTISVSQLKRRRRPRSCKTCMLRPPAHTKTRQWMDVVSKPCTFDFLVFHLALLSGWQLLIFYPSVVSSFLTQQHKKMEYGCINDPKPNWRRQITQSKRRSLYAFRPGQSHSSAMANQELEVGLGAPVWVARPHPLGTSGWRRNYARGVARRFESKTFIDVFQGFFNHGFENFAVSFGTRRFMKSLQLAGPPCGTQTRGPPRTSVGF